MHTHPALVPAEAVVPNVGSVGGFKQHPQPGLGGVEEDEDEDEAEDEEEDEEGAGGAFVRALQELLMAESRFGDAGTAQTRGLSGCNDSSAIQQHQHQHQHHVDPGPGPGQEQEQEQEQALAGRSLLEAHRITQELLRRLSNRLTQAYSDCL